MHKEIVSLKTFKRALKLWAIDAHESYDIDFDKAYAMYVKRFTDMSWLSSYIERVNYENLIGCTGTDG